MWTLFWDMHSGGGTKVEPFDKIYIEAPQEEAEEVFKDHFGRDPNSVTCTCCGEDYSIEDHPTLDAATQFHRRKYHQPIESLEDYIARSDVLLIYEESF